MEKQKASFMVALLVILLCSSSSLISCSNTKEAESVVELELEGTTITTTTTISDDGQVDACRTKKCNIACNTNAQCQTKNCRSSCPSCNKVGFPNEQKRCGAPPDDVSLLELPVTHPENTLVI
ncbi:PREDICTED: uncharacterized protein LOC109175354 [Ipomoea nil]|uniref:uncharacterized protein LOC109175354 n=1 Tax=Ipomoea nil TaxID=35883 RepID=UPI000900F33A|nr:PREDICTED: uncharacterized protein LOC109175354 [Ipomoea nil]